LGGEPCPAGHHHDVEIEADINAELLDPLARQLQWGHGPHAPASAQTQPSNSASAAALEQLASALLRRAAVGRSERGPVLQLEFGQGELDGVSVLLEPGSSGVALTVQAPPGADPSALFERIQERLRLRGVVVDRLDYR